VQEGVGLVARVELEIDDHAALVVLGVSNGLGPDTRLATHLGEGGERRNPRRQVGDRVLDMQKGHEQNVRIAIVGAYPRKVGISYCSNMAPSGSPTTRAIERVESLCRDHVRERPLRVALINELRRSIGFDWYAWLLTDPETEVGSSPLADTPSLPDLPRLIRFKYLTDVNRWTGLTTTATTLHAATSGALERSLAWREVLSSYGVVDVASLVFRDAHGCWGFVDLWRSGEAGPFSERDLDHLAAIVGPVTHALRRSQAHTFDEATPLPARSGPLVLVLSPALEVKAQTPETEAYLRSLVPPDGDRRPVPAGAYNVAAQLLAVEAGVDDHPPSARVHLGGGVWLTLRAARVDADGPSPEHDIAVTIEPTSPSERRSLFARSHALSPREVELLDRLSEGADTRTVARGLFLSEHTVQDHLKSIFVKTGAHNRRTLLARIAGT
jgi:DNA-binding CsgD family transcriptional regulator